MTQLKQTHIAVLPERAPNNSNAHHQSEWINKFCGIFIQQNITQQLKDWHVTTWMLLKIIMLYERGQTKCMFLNMCNLLYFNYTSVKLLRIIKLGNFNDNWLHSTWRCYKTINYIKIGQLIIHQMLKTRNEKRKDTAIEMNHKKG